MSEFTRHKISRRKIQELKHAMQADNEIARELGIEPRGYGDQVVYFVQIAGQLESPIKIGYTGAARLEDRLTGLQVGCPFRLRLLATMPGGPEVEGRLHEAFAHAHVSGEWFEPTPALLALIDGLPNCVRLDAPEAT